MSDHLPLKYLLTTEVPEARLARLINRFRLYDYEIHYRQGKHHGNADALSRMVEEGVYRDNYLEEDNNLVINAIRLLSYLSNKTQLNIIISVYKVVSLLFFFYYFSIFVFS